MPVKKDSARRIEEICEKTAGKLGYELCAAQIEKEPAGRYLRVYIDVEGGVTLDDCERMHRAVQPLLEDIDYDFLEVSSPGIDRPLKTRRDIEKSIGLVVEAKMYRPVEGRKSVQGVLREMNDDRVVIEDNGQTVELPRKAVAQVRLVPDLSALDGDEE